MGKLAGVMLSIGLLTTILLFSQETEGAPSKTYRRMDVYLEGNSGTLVDSTDGTLSGNELELGLKYSQNFERAPWLTLYVTGSFIGSVNWNRRNLNTNQNQDIAPKWSLNGASGATFGGNYIETGLLTKYASLAIRHNLFIKAYLYGPVDLNQHQKITFFFGVEAFPYFRGQKKIGLVDGEATAPSLDVLALGIQYSINFAKDWLFSTSLSYRTHGGGTGDSALASVWEVDSARALRYNSYFRWENTISYTNPKGISLWFMLRYQPSYFVNNPLKDYNKRNGAVKHDVFLKYGLTYFYNFSKQ